MGKARLSEMETFAGYQAFEFFYPDLSKAPPESILIHNAGWFQLLSLQYVYALRPDTSLVTMSGLQAPSVMTYPSQLTLPLVSFPKDPSGNLIPPFADNYIQMFFNANLENGKRIFINYNQDADDYMPYLEPNQEFMWMGELKPDNLVGWNALHNGEYTNFLLRSQNYFHIITNDPKIPFSRKSVPYLYYIHQPVFIYTLQNHLYEVAADTIKSYFENFAYKDGKLMISYDLMRALSYMYADTLKSMGDFEKALKIIENVIKLRPSSPMNHLSLALIYEKENKGEDALNSLKKAYNLDPYLPYIANRYFMAIARYKSINDAINFIDSHISVLEKSGFTSSMKNMEFLKACMLLKPNELYPPEGDRFLQLYYKQFELRNRN
jgi:tetratricopeptide (TPR) repeat protein